MQLRLVPQQPPPALGAVDEPAGVRDRNVAVLAAAADSPVGRIGASLTSRGVCQRRANRLALLAAPRAMRNESTKSCRFVPMRTTGGGDRRYGGRWRRKRQRRRNRSSTRGSRYDVGATCLPRQRASGSSRRVGGHGEPSSMPFSSMAKVRRAARTSRGWQKLTPPVKRRVWSSRFTHSCGVGVLLSLATTAC